MPELDAVLSMLPNLAEDRALFRRVEDWSNRADGDGSPPDYDAAFFQTLTEAEGIDFSTAFLFHHLVHQPGYAEVRQRIHAVQTQAEPVRITKDALVAVIPGAFYREHPETGADGQVIRETAERLGFQAELIPVQSVGCPSENARLICDWLKSRQDVLIILASLSKGGADLKLALREPDALACFRNVVAWLNVGGILGGSPMIRWLFRRKLRTLLYRLIFYLRGQDFGVIQALHPGPEGLLGAALDAPLHWQIIHVAGFPLRRHMSSSRAECWHRRLSAWGPNDSVMLLTELAKLPGLVFPIWGTDHYLQSRWDASALVRSLLCHIGEEQHLF